MGEDRFLEVVQSVIGILRKRSAYQRSAFRGGGKFCLPRTISLHAAPPYGYVYAVTKPKKRSTEIRQKCPITDQTQSIERSDTNGERSDNLVRNKEAREKRKKRERDKDALPISL